MVQGFDPFSDRFEVTDVKNMKSFSIRSSGRMPGKCYIDLMGSYRASDIATMTGIGQEALEHLYISGGAVLDESLGVFYFPSREAALEALKALESHFCSHEFGKAVYLTFEEIEYIRKALINEGSNIINVRNDLKKCIFDKFNS